MAYTSTWVSHSSISDFLKCPRAYYLKNVYHRPQTGHKIKLMTPALALGQIVHEVLESLSKLPTNKRFSTPLIDLYTKAWGKVSGLQGGFANKDIEHRYFTRGQEMLSLVKSNPGPISRPAVKIQAEKDLPKYSLSPEDDIILCGKIDWLEYLPESDSVHIIDFKTSTREEDPDSLQLPIYYLLVKNCQKRQIAKASYWYLENDTGPVEKLLPNYEDSVKEILTIAKKIKLARTFGRFVCPNNGCFHCLPYEKIVNDKCQLVGQDSYGADIFVDLSSKEKIPDSIIL
ncbi:MAG: PD-(D/E)XK nuclease family protein [Candidatus Shapirobacteria bacterium]|jgi:CRISPR/Cas system-associated exonuclease Cas4 (RecB family)